MSSGALPVPLDSRRAFLSMQLRRASRSRGEARNVRLHVHHLIRPKWDFSEHEFHPRCREIANLLDHRPHRNGAAGSEVKHTRGRRRRGDRGDRARGVVDKEPIPLLRADVVCGRRPESISIIAVGMSQPSLSRGP